MTRKGKIWIAVAVVVLVPVVAPWFTLSRAKAGILQSLQASLGRRIEADSVHLNLFPRPGVELDGVRLGDDPAFGLEDMVMADSAVASFQLTALLRGKLVFARVHLENPSINLVRNRAGQWNIAALLNRTASIGQHAARAGHAQRAAATRLPYLDWSNARINFKLDQTKTHLYLDQVEGSLARESGDWRLQARFVPERSDLRLSNTGEVRVDGRWKAGADSFQDQAFTAAVSLRNSYLAGSSALVAGHDAGVHGILNAQVQLQGTGRRISISGSAAVQSLRRWDLLPPPASVRASFAGAYEPAADRLTITGIGDPGWRDFQLAGDVTGLFSTPAVQLTLQLRKFDAAHLLPLALALKSHLPADLAASGTVDGDARLAWKWGTAPSGTAAFKFQQMRLGDEAASLRVPGATVNWQGGRMQLAPDTATLVVGGHSRTLQLGARLDGHGVAMSVSSRALDGAAAAALAQLLGLHSPWPPAVAGEARVALQLSAPWAQWRSTQWSGTARFATANFRPVGSSIPAIALRPLTVTLGGGNPLSAQFRLAGLPIAGRLQYAAGLQLRLTAAEPVAAAEVWTLLQPGRPDLVRRVLGDVLGTPAAMPSWLLPLHAQAGLDFAQLNWHGIPVHLQMQLRAQAGGWNSPSLTFATAGGEFTGQGSVAVDGYHVRGGVAASAPLHLATLLAPTPYAGRLSGALSGSVQLTRPPAGGDLRHVAAAGDFSLRDGSLATADGPWRFQRCRGTFALREGEAAITGLDCQHAGETYRGSAEVTFAGDGSLSYTVTLRHGPRTIHLLPPVTPRMPR